VCVRVCSRTIGGARSAFVRIKWRGLGVHNSVAYRGGSLQVAAGKFNFVYPTQAAAAVDVVSLQEDVLGKLAGPDASQGCDAIMVILILALFCTGESDQQLELAFRCFDADNSNDMDEQEMRDFVQVLATAAFKVCVARWRLFVRFMVPHHSVWCVVRSRVT